MPPLLVVTSQNNNDSTSALLSALHLHESPMTWQQSAVCDRIGSMALAESVLLARKSRLCKRTVPRVSWNDIQNCDTLLGKGTYCHVFRGTYQDRIVAVKSLQPHVMMNPKDFQGTFYLQDWLDMLYTHIVDSHKSFVVTPNTPTHIHIQPVAATDLAIEGEILSRLQHPNVITLHAISRRETAHSMKDGHFLVLDALQETLRDRLRSLKMKHRGSTSIDGIIADIAPIALGVAQGLCYLHSQNVVLRDLKPDNIGFARDGGPRLFDLGFAREAHTLLPTEVAGSYRYMAPEVGLRRGTTLQSDVYSFGVLLWVMCTMKTPFGHVSTCAQFKEQVMKKGWREPVEHIPRGIRKLIERCWHADPLRRPTMTQVLQTLQVELALYTVRHEGSTEIALLRDEAPRKMSRCCSSHESLKSYSRFLSSRRSHGSSSSSIATPSLRNSSYGSLRGYGKHNPTSSPCPKNAIWSILKPLGRRNNRRSSSNESHDRMGPLSSRNTNLRSTSSTGSLTHHSGSRHRHHSDSGMLSFASSSVE
jgi:serine/threonine protein kinase